MTQDDSWLLAYYSKVQSEYQISFNKKDQLTNWALTVLLAMFATYFGLLNAAKLEHSWYIFASLIGALIILIQFFVNSLLAYGFLKKWRLIKEDIENHWISPASNLNKILENLRSYDHGRRLNIGIKDMVWAQLRAGFLVVLAAPLFLLAIEIGKVSVWTNEYYYTLTILAVYICWQIAIVKGYDQFRIRNKRQNEKIEGGSK